MNVDVIVLCGNCEPDENGERFEMIGASKMYEFEGKQQSRLYVCPNCDNHTTVVIELKS
jgi:hypothetical protein